MHYQLSYLNKQHDIDVREEKDEFVITIGQDVYRFKDCIVEGCQVSYRFEGGVRRMYFAQDSDKYYLAVDGEYYTFGKAKGSVHGPAETTAEKNSVVSSMPGLLVKMPVKVGEVVKAGDTLAIVEAMKMQNELRAPRDGVVKQVNFTEGEQVDAFQPIVELDSTKELKSR
jgi:biotin carboxyl carrier protein